MRLADRLTENTDSSQGTRSEKHSLAQRLTTESQQILQNLACTTLDIIDSAAYPTTCMFGYSIEKAESHKRRR